jgi:hypothetical protein
MPAIRRSRRAQNMKSGDFSYYALGICGIISVLTACSKGVQLVSRDGILYTAANVRIENSLYNLELNNDGSVVSKNVFVITESNETGGPYCNVRGMNETATLSLASQGSNAFEVNDGYVARLVKGSRIGPAQSFMTGSEKMEFTLSIWEQGQMYCEPVRAQEGNWPAKRRGYIGLALPIGGKIHYGWAAITVDGGYGFLSARLTGYAYQAVAGKAIMAGQE